MARFTYTAERSGGEVYRGTAEASDRFALYEIVRREGARIISVSEASSQSIWSMRYWNMKLARISEYDRILFARNLGAMLAAGLPLSRALTVMDRQTKNIKLAEIIAEIENDIRRGDTLHDALGRQHAFSHLFVAMVRAGEEGGDLSASLLVVAEQMERMYTLKKKIRGALIYPCIIIVAIIGIGFLMMTQVVPTLAETFSEMKVSLPPQTQVIIAVSNFLVHYTALAILGVTVLIAGFYSALRTRLGRRASDFTLLHLPVIGDIVREVNAARTSRTLASLLSSGVDVLTSIKIVSEVVQNSYFRDVLSAAEHNVGAGEPLSAAFTRRDDLYPAFVGEMMAVGEETGESAEMLKRLAVFYEDEVDRKTKDMSTIIEPLLMILIGGAVGFFAVSIITPIYSLSQNIS